MTDWLPFLNISSLLRKMKAAQEEQANDRIRRKNFTVWNVQGISL